MLFPVAFLVLSSHLFVVGTDHIGTKMNENECLNIPHSQCAGYQRLSPSSEHVYEVEGSGKLDDQEMLAHRLRDVDTLDQGLEFVLNINSESKSSWYSRNKSELSLRQVLVLHRHGDRTPINFPPKDPLADEPFWAFHGLGQLTNRGKSRVHLLGKMYRNRYNNFLEKSVNKNQRISRSSGALRCIESAQMFLSSFLALDVDSCPDSSGLKWSHDKDNKLASLWQPASVLAVPVEIDGMLAEGSKCKALTNDYEIVINNSDEVKFINEQFANVSKVMQEELGFEIDMFYKWTWAGSLIEVERSYFEDKLNPKILAIYDSLEKAGNMALKPYQSTLTSRRLRAGLLINDMVQNMKTLRELHIQLGAESKSPNMKKFVHYSAHDLTIVVVLGILDAWQTDSIRPDYASNVAIELHEDEMEWFVKIYYMNMVPSEPSEIHIARCEDGHPKGRCTLDKFIELMSVYAIDSWLNWFSECQNDFQSIDPYKRAS